MQEVDKMKINQAKQIDDDQYFESIDQKDFMALSYPEQSKSKIKYVHDQFVKNAVNTKVNPLIISDHPKYYRHKVTATATNVKKHGKLQLKLGFYIENTHKIKPVFESVLHDKTIEKTLKNIEQLFIKYKITAYQKGHDRGIIKHVLMRKSYANDALLIVFVTQGNLLPNAKRIIQELREKNEQIKSVVQIIQKNDTHIVLYGDEKTLYGPGYITDEIDGLRFRLSAKSFYQINPEQMMKLYHQGFELIDINKHEYVMDCYSGIGTLSLLAAKKAKEVVAVEQNVSAVKDAIGNAKSNKISNVRFVKDDAANFIATYKQNVDVLIIDPPRIGVSQSFIEAIKKLKPKRILYISCFVETQVRDIKQLNRLYEVKAIQPVDMFPNTTHVENITTLYLK